MLLKENFKYDDFFTNILMILWVIHYGGSGFLLDCLYPQPEKGLDLMINVQEVLFGRMKKAKWLVRNLGRLMWCKSLVCCQGSGPDCWTNHFLLSVMQILNLAGEKTTTVESLCFWGHQIFADWVGDFCVETGISEAWIFYKLTNCTKSLVWASWNIVQNRVQNCLCLLQPHEFGTVQFWRYVQVQALHLARETKLPSINVGHVEYVEPDKIRYKYL